MAPVTSTAKPTAPAATTKPPGTPAPGKAEGPCSDDPPPKVLNLDDGTIQTVPSRPQSWASKSDVVFAFEIPDDEFCERNLDSCTSSFAMQAKYCTKSCGMCPVRRPRHPARAL